MEFPKKHSYNFKFYDIMSLKLSVSKMSKIRFSYCPKAYDWQCGIQYRSE